VATIVRSVGSPRIRSFVYWLATANVAGELALGGVWDLLRTDYVRDIFERLEYPEYLLTILGVPKLVAAVVLVVPGVPRMKEWAYAGAMFTYVGDVAVDDAATALVTPSVYAVLTAVSWALRPPSRRDFTSNRPSGTDSFSTSMTLSRSSSR
jgi:DoxX-like family